MNNKSNDSKEKSESSSNIEQDLSKILECSEQRRPIYQLQVSNKAAEYQQSSQTPQSSSSQITSQDNNNEQ